MPKEAARKTGQVNIPLTQKDEEVLRALAFLEGVSAAKVVGPVVEKFLRKRSKRRDVQLALEALAAKRAEDQGEVTSLEAHRSARSQGS
ncbi:MAG: hypothetical protein ACRDNG_03980 [Gaiellaceae bacterium]